MKVIRKPNNGMIIKSKDFTLGVEVDRNTAKLFIEGANVTTNLSNDKIKDYIVVDCTDVFLFLFDIYIWLKDNSNIEKTRDFFIEGSFISPIFRIKNCENNMIHLRVVPDYANRYNYTFYGIDYLTLNKKEFLENLFFIINELSVLCPPSNVEENYISNLKIGA